MSAIDNAIAILQDHALASTDLTIKAAPDYPVSSAGALPMAIAHLSAGAGTAMDASSVMLLANVNVDFHFSRTSMKLAYTQIQACAVEYLQRISGDPTLGGTVDTIVFPVTFEVLPTEWDSVPTQMLQFTIPLKTLETPIT